MLNMEYIYCRHATSLIVTSKEMSAGHDTSGGFAVSISLFTPVAHIICAYFKRTLDAVFILFCLSLGICLDCQQLPGICGSPYSLYMYRKRRAILFLVLIS